MVAIGVSINYVQDTLIKEYMREFNLHEIQIQTLLALTSKEKDRELSNIYTKHYDERYQVETTEMKMTLGHFMYLKDLEKVENILLKQLNGGE